MWQISTTFKVSSLISYILAALIFAKISVVDADDCQPSCHPGHGICHDGQCFCNDPWIGDDCSSVAPGSDSGSLAPSDTSPSTAAQTGEKGAEDEVDAQPDSLEDALLGDPPPSHPTSKHWDATHHQQQEQQVQKPSRTVPVTQVQQEQQVQQDPPPSRTVPVTQQLQGAVGALQIHADPAHDYNLQGSLAMNAAAGTQASTGTSEDLQNTPPTYPIMSINNPGFGTFGTPPEHTEETIPAYGTNADHMEKRIPGKTLLDNILHARRKKLPQSVAANEGSLPPPIAARPPDDVVSRGQNPNFLGNEPPHGHPDSSWSRFTPDRSFPGLGPGIGMQGVFAPGQNVQFKDQNRPERDQTVFGATSEQSTKASGQTEIRRLRNTRASLRHELEQLNKDANELKLSGDSVASTVLRDLKPVDNDLELVGVHAKSRASTFEVWMAVGPIIFQVVLFLSFLVFKVLDHYVIGEDGIDDAATGCTQFIVYVARWLSEFSWTTIAALLLYLVILDAYWAYMCFSGLAEDSLNIILTYCYYALLFIGLFGIVGFEVYNRYLRRHMEQVEFVADKVTYLVALLEVKYAKALGEKMLKVHELAHQHAGNALSKADDFTDFIGLTEFSSDDEAQGQTTIWNSCGRKNPASKAAGESTEERNERKNQKFQKGRDMKEKAKMTKFMEDRKRMLKEGMCGTVGRSCS